MEDFIYIGKIVNTHGIHGEVRLLSDFDRKDKVFQPVVITNYRKHKNFDMICLEGYHDINQVLRFKGLNAYVQKEDLNLGEEELLERDYIGMEAFFENNCFGKIISIENYGLGNKIFVIDYRKKRILIPFQKVFIKKISKKESRVYFQEVEGLIS